jgi:hypothetical protein
VWIFNFLNFLKEGSLFIIQELYLLGQKVFHGTSEYTGCFAYFNIGSRLMIRSCSRVSFNDSIYKYVFIFIRLGKFLNIMSNPGKFIVGPLPWANYSWTMCVHIRTQWFHDILGTPVYVNGNFKQVLYCKKIIPN